MQFFFNFLKLSSRGHDGKNLASNTFIENNNELNNNELTNTLTDFAKEDDILSPDHEDCPWNIAVGVTHVYPVTHTPGHIVLTRQ